MGTVAVSDGRSYTLSSPACSDLLNSMATVRGLSSPPTGSICSTDPVTPSAIVYWKISSSSLAQFTINSVSGFSSTTGTTGTGSTGTTTTGGTTGTATGTTSTSSGTLTLTVKLEPAPPSAERINDLMQLFYLSIAFLIVIYGGKKLLSLFDSNHDKD